MRVITELIHDVPGRLKAQKKVTLNSKLQLAAYTEMGRRTGFQVRRINEGEEANVKDKGAKECPKEGPKKGQKGKTQKEGKLHYVLDYHYDHLSEQPMPNCGWSLTW